MVTHATDDPLHRWFASLVEESFQTRLGLGEPALLNYLADLLTEFIHIERINQLCDGSGRSVDDLAEMIQQVVFTDSTLSPDRRRAMHRHIGDFTLFWTGVYPENLKQLHRRNTRDALLSYFDQGKRSYLIASDLSNDTTQPTAEVLRMLSDQFEYCVYGLGLVRQGWESTPPDGPALTMLE